jgi:hypothetical protein
LVTAHVAALLGLSQGKGCTRTQKGYGLG